ncbi:hypothetical protein ACK03K_33955 [[Kitasatospora] papulosa]|uniref:hypothetical protein n=1 Tax=[Kitasatospora] papulosa TaxID=1464011 RepID=UPI003907EFBD
MKIVESGPVAALEAITMPSASVHSASRVLVVSQSMPLAPAKNSNFELSNGACSAVGPTVPDAVSGELAATSVGVVVSETFVYRPTAKLAARAGSSAATSTAR